MVKFNRLVTVLAVAAGLAGCIKKDVPQGAAKPGVSSASPETSGTGTNQTEPKPTLEQGS